MCIYNNKVFIFRPFNNYVISFKLALVLRYLQTIFALFISFFIYELQSHIVKLSLFNGIILVSLWLDSLSRKNCKIFS